MRIFKFLLLILLFHSAILFAQPPCGSNPAANDICGNATPICNLNGYCGNTSASYTNWVSSSNHTSETSTPLGAIFCATIQNNSWIKFIASSTSAVFSVWVSNCADNKGVQMQIYSTNDCYNFTAVSNCWNPQTPTNGQITATGLVPGQVYYFMIDGAQGDNCDYVIAANSGVTTSPVITQDQLICRGNSATIAVAGGNTYAWTSIPYDASLSGQTTHASVTVAPTVTTTYLCTVTTAGSNAFCTNNNNVLASVVTVAPLPVISTTFKVEHCDLADGTATVTTQGDSLLYQYIWNSSPAQSTPTATNLAAGSYSVTVTDTNNCRSSASVTVINVPFLTPEIAGDSSFCTGHSTVLDAGNYISYLWSNGDTTQTTQVSNPGIYSVYVSMNEYCHGWDSVVVIENPNPVPVISGNPLICPQVPASIDAGVGYVSYLWSTGDTLQAIAVTLENTYHVTVTDSNHCLGSDDIQVISNNGPYLTAITQNEICGRANGTVLIQATGGLGGYTYNWSNGTGLALDTGLAQGVYQVTVSDGNCNVSEYATVNETPGPTAKFIVQPSLLILSELFVTASFNDNSSGTVIDWSWDFGDTTYVGSGSEITHDYFHVGYYPVTHVVSDTNGCTDTLVKELQILDIYTCYIPNGFTPSSTDDLNNWFGPVGTNWLPEGFEMYVFDRWGKQMFHSNDVTHCLWNGTLNNSGTSDDTVMGVYPYVIRIQDILKQMHEYTGSVTLLK
jgi:hypothetical protein